jgi:glucose 1-dehydrogenase
VLVTGAGPIGMLAALLRAQRGLDVHVIDQVTDGLKPELVAALGATYHHGSVTDLAIEPDVVIECTGVAQLIFDVMDCAGSNGIVCLTGGSSGGRSLSGGPGRSARPRRRGPERTAWSRRRRPRRRALGHRGGGA